MARVLRMIAAILLLGAGLSCSSGPGQSSDNGAVEVRDSAGIEIVENRNLVSGKTLGRALEEQNRSTLPDVELSYVNSMLLLGDSGIAVSNNGTSQLLLVDPKTYAAHAVGRRGQGPGEFAFAPEIHRCIGDTLMAFTYPSRVNVFDTAGGFVRMIQITPPPPFMVSVAGVASDCSALVIVKAHPVRPAPSEGSYSTRYTIEWYDIQSETATEMASTQSIEAGVVDFRGIRTGLQMPFGNLPSWFVTADRLYLAHGNQPEILVYNQRGELQRIIRWEAQPEPITAADRQRHNEIRSTLDQRFGPGTMIDFPDINDFPLPKVKPLYSRLLIDDMGYIWLQRYPTVWEGFERIMRSVFETQDREWWLFSPRGVLLGMVLTPVEVLIHDIRGGLAIGIIRGEDDVEMLAQYPLSSEVRKGQSR